MVSNVIDFYSDKTIFITGGTGFLGICLIEKLLRSIPDIKNIYLLLRPKKGKQIDERLEEFKKNSVRNIYSKYILYIILLNNFFFEL